MNEHDQLMQNLTEVIKQSADGSSIRNAESLLSQYIHEIVFDDIHRQEDIVKQIDMQLDAEGDITIATSLKIPNLKFRFGDFLFEIAGAGTSIGSGLSQDNMILLVFAAVKFLWNVRKLATLTLDQKDAELLLTLHRLAKEEGVVTTDQIEEIAGIDIDRDQVYQSLEKLEHLGCITLTMEEIHLNEIIVIRKQL